MAAPMTPMSHMSPSREARDGPDCWGRYGTKIRNYWEGRKFIRWNFFLESCSQIIRIFKTL